MNFYVHYFKFIHSLYLCSTPNPLIFKHHDKNRFLTFVSIYGAVVLKCLFLESPELYLFLVYNSNARLLRTEILEMVMKLVNTYIRSYLFECVCLYMFAVRWSFIFRLYELMLRSLNAVSYVKSILSCVIHSLTTFEKEHQHLERQQDRDRDRQ